MQEDTLVDLIYYHLIQPNHLNLHKQLDQTSKNSSRNNWTKVRLSAVKLLYCFQLFLLFLAEGRIAPKIVLIRVADSFR